MGFIRSSRERRIDRALQSILDAIDVMHDDELKFCHTWRDVDDHENYVSRCRIEAMKRADKLHATWARIVANSGE